MQLKKIPQKSKSVRQFSFVAVHLQPIRQLLIMPNAKPSAIFLIAINRIAFS
jgi:hypothetical protein